MRKKLYFLGKNIIYKLKYLSLNKSTDEIGQTSVMINISLMGFDSISIAEIGVKIKMWFAISWWRNKILYFIMIWSYDFKLSEYSALMFCLTAQFWLLLCFLSPLYLGLSSLSNWLPLSLNPSWILLPPFSFPLSCETSSFTSVLKPFTSELRQVAGHKHWWGVWNVPSHPSCIPYEGELETLRTLHQYLQSFKSGVQQEGWLGMLWTVHKYLQSFKSHLTCSAWGVTWNVELFTIVCNVSSQLSCVNNHREWLAKVVNCSPIFAKFQVTPHAEGMRGWLETLPMFGPTTGLRSHAVVSVWIWSWALLYFRGIHPAKLYKWKYDLKQRQKRTHSQIERNSWLTLWFLYD